MQVFERYFGRNSSVKLPDFRNDPEVIVIIPVFNDPEIFATIDSLCACSCRSGHAGVIVVVNYGEHCPEEVKRQNRQLAEDLQHYVQACNQKQSGLCFYLLEAYDLPAKFAGVGLARKMAMDAAAYWFYRQGKTEAPILSLDADTLVAPDYLEETLAYFAAHRVAGVSIAYAHRWEEPECSPEMREAIIRYELYLRYYQLALGYTGHPHAYHCIGSAFAVRASDYVAQGGMNKRQAGEDFYFLQKLIATGRYATLTSTKVFPSSRFSDRTPFGTGRAVRQIMENNGRYPVYHFDAFRQLKTLFDGMPTLFKVGEKEVAAYFALQSQGVRDFLSENDGIGMVAEANANSASLRQFTRRFFDHFNAFRVLKYMNYVHEQIYKKIDITEAVAMLFQELGYPYSENQAENLELLRK